MATLEVEPRQLLAKPPWVADRVFQTDLTQEKVLARPNRFLLPLARPSRLWPPLARLNRLCPDFWRGRRDLRPEFKPHPRRDPLKHVEAFNGIYKSLVSHFVREWNINFFIIFLNKKTVNFRTIANFKN